MREQTEDFPSTLRPMWGFLRTVQVFCVVLSLSLLSPLFAEEILEYHLDVEVLADGTIEGTERILIIVDHQAVRLGIYRDYETAYYPNHKRIETPYQIISVTRDGAPEHYWTEAVGKDTMRLLTGAEQNLAANYLPKGVAQYEIKWRSENHIRSFKEYDELYYNVTGNGWKFPINQVSARVTLPAGASIIQAASYYGKMGSTLRGVEVSRSDNTIEFRAARALNSGEGLTIAVGFTPDVVEKQGFVAGPIDHFNNGILERLPTIFSSTSIPFLVSASVLFLFYLGVWFFVARGKTSHAIGIQYYPPAELSVGDVMALAHRRVIEPMRVINVTLIDLAVRGYVTFDTKGIRRNFRGLSDLPADEDEKHLLMKLFGWRKSLSDYAHAQILFKTPPLQAYLALTQHTEALQARRKKHITNHNGWLTIGILIALVILYCYPKSPGENLATAIMVFILGFVALFVYIYTMGEGKDWRLGDQLFHWIFALFFFPPFLLMVPFLVGSLEITPAVFGFAIAGLLNVAVFILFAYLFERPKEPSVLLVQQVQALREKMEITDKARYQILPPEEFEYLLPYAIIFGIDQGWVSNFMDANRGYQPKWYRERQFNAHSYRASLNQTSGFAQPSGLSGSSFGGSSRSSSGSGGGGSSGGGSGGGGGGGR